ncbi:hypothetical protein SK128_026909 [Halocaridina rubra]|uniref:Uncharacterized protein n=1 Tax=Halocaridina rubra TaxID=373956 RepID=A0AAN8WRL9_HALRR
MSDKGETSRKSDPMGRRERRDSQDTSNMSMRVNVMYRGIVYRVRGVKVLCSVITAVILLLVAIVGLGVWMLVSAYAEEKSELYSGEINNTSLALPQDIDGRGVDASTVLSIDFNAPSVTLDELSVPANIPSGHSSENIPFSETIGHFQGITPGKEVKASSRSPGPDPPFGLFSGFLDMGFGASPESITPQPTTTATVAGDWTPVVNEKVSDSMVEFSENRPVVIAYPGNYYSDYEDGPLDDFIRDSNYADYPDYVGIQDQKGDSSPVSNSPLPDLPDDIPRDIPPTLMSEKIPFPFPPSLATVPTHLWPQASRPGWRQNYQRQRPGLRRVNPVMRQGQQPSNSGIQRLPGYHRPMPPFDQVRDYTSQISDERNSDQQQNARPQERLPTRQPSTVRESHTEPFEGSVSPSTQNFSILQQYGINEGDILPQGITLPSGFTFPGGTLNGRPTETNSKRRRPSSPSRYLEDMMYYYNKHERPRNPSATAATNPGNLYSQRKGVPSQDGDPDDTGSVKLERRGSSSQQKPEDSVFKHFWDVYDSQGKPPAHHEDRGPVPEDTQTWDSPRHPHMFPYPNIRGARPNGQGYPIRIRPDAESPDRMLIVDPGNIPHSPHERPVPTHPEQQQHSFLGPLQDIYQYSQKLAATILNFPSNLLTQVDDARAEYMQKEVELLEDYNKVFQQPGITSSDVLPDMFDDRPDRDERVMLLDTESIRSLDPFEISLITWTFIDFWEFLIEKVGTLSRDDLRQLEMRLERLRQQKDHRMAKSLITVTVDRVSSNSPKDSPAVDEIIHKAEELLETVPDIGENITKIIQNKSENGSSTEFQGRMWDPLGIFDSEQRVRFMEYAVKIILKFGRVYLRKKYAVDCLMLLFCKDLNTNSRKEGMDGMVAKVKSEREGSDRFPSVTIKTASFWEKTTITTDEGR